ncbi:MAG: DUF3187 family protein [Planctomycetes bacterium]|nr:DUF3187 family protein [Planctomycetota bacterium]
MCASSSPLRICAALALAFCAGPMLGADDARPTGTPVEIKPSDPVPAKSAESPAEPAADESMLPPPPHLNVGRGPLGIRNAYPLAINHLMPAVEHPRTLVPHTGEVAFMVDWANSLGFERNRFRVDGEGVRAQVELAYSCVPNIEFRLGVPYLHRGGGSMDGLIDSWHGITGLPEHSNVNDFRRNDINLTLSDTRGGTFLRTKTDSDLGDAVFSTKFTLTEGTEQAPAWGAIVSVRLPTGNNAKRLGSSSVDVGGALLLSKRIGDFFLYLNGGVTYFGDTDLGGVDYRETRPYAAFALEYQISDRVSAVTQFTFTSGLLERLGELSDAQGDIGVGIQWGIAPRAQLEIGIIEGIMAIDAVPDFGVHVGLRIGF